jgi:hypothetical protein
VLGLAEIEAGGGAGGGGGGGGGGATFFLQAPNNITAPSMTTRVIHFSFCCFTFSSVLLRSRMRFGSRLKRNDQPGF